jgi:hypothetical protein
VFFRSLRSSNARPSVKKVAASAGHDLMDQAWQ